MDCGLPGSSIHRIFQARVLEWVAISFTTQRLNPVLLYCRQTLYHLWCVWFIQKPSSLPVYGSIILHKIGPWCQKSWGPLWGLSKELLAFWCEIWRVTCGMSPLESKQYIQRKLNSYAWKVLLRLFIIDNVNGSHWFSGPALEMVWNK